MNLNNRWLGPVLLIVVLIVTSMVTVAAPGLISSLTSGGGPGRPESIDIPHEAAEMETVRFDIDGYIVGEELIKVPALAAVNDNEASSIRVLLALTGIVVVAVLLFAGPIAIFMRMGQSQTLALAADDSYKASASGLETKIKDIDKEKNKAQPKTGKPDHNRPQVAAWATGVMVVFMAYMFGYTLGDGIWQGAGGGIANVFALGSIVLGWYFFRPNRLVKVESEGTEGKINYGPTVWVTLSGAIMMGLGIGFMFVVISGGDPLPFLIWDPAPRINWEYLNELIQPLLT